MVLDLKVRSSISQRRKFTIQDPSHRGFILAEDDGGNKSTNSTTSPKKGIGEATGTVLLTPNERRVTEDRRNCYWLYFVTNCDTKPIIQEPINDPARLEWHEVKKVAHYWLKVDAMKRPMMVQENKAPYGGHVE